MVLQGGWNHSSFGTHLSCSAKGSHRTPQGCGQPSPAQPTPRRDLSTESSASHLLPHGHAASPGVLDGTSGQCESPATALGHIPYRYPRSPAPHPGLGQHPQSRSNDVEHAASSPSAAGHKAAARGGQRRGSDAAPVTEGDAAMYPTAQQDRASPGTPGTGLPCAPHARHTTQGSTSQAGSRELLPASTPGTDSPPWQPAPLLVPAPLSGDAAPSMLGGAGRCEVVQDASPGTPARAGPGRRWRIPPTISETRHGHTEPCPAPGAAVSSSTSTLPVSRPLPGSPPRRPPLTPSVLPLSWCSRGAPGCPRQWGGHPGGGRGHFQRVASGKGPRAAPAGSGPALLSCC